jgi:dienelactone hydrolase
MPRLFVVVSSLIALSVTTAAYAQGSSEDYRRASGLRTRYDGLAINVVDGVAWIDETHEFSFRRSVRGGHEFVVMNADTSQKRPAFDHERLAGALSDASGNKYTAAKLPFTTFRFVDAQSAIEATFEGVLWRCGLSDYRCRRQDVGGRGGGFAGPTPPCEPRATDRPVQSPDKRLEALIVNHNLAIRETGKSPRILTTDGSEGQCYQLSSIRWSPDSKTIALYRVRPGYRRMVHYVESSPEDQLQPKHSSRFYAKPGDVLDMEQPVLFHIDGGRQLTIDNALFANPYDVSELVWRKDSSAVTFEYNQRGHQVYRVIEINAATGSTRAVISEEPKTFFNYRKANGGLADSGKKFRFDAADGKDIIWMSERDGWNHLYLYDGAAGRVKHQITKGHWVVRGIQKVDEAKRQIWFSAGGTDAGSDPYFARFYRINVDGSGLTRLTTENANHNAVYSRDMQYFVDTYSRVDLAPIAELRRGDDGTRVAEIDRGDLTALVEAGWRPPEVFTAIGRDGRTDIWGVIYRPINFDSSKRYPVIENIYAGPQGSFVPKSFAAFNQMQAQAELGFIVVQIDGMGTSNKSKSFHDVAWMDLGDAGFADRILWHKAVAAKYSWYDIDRVGVYGTSAGGQNSMGALLFHPEFYKAAVSAAGCHDNRMDKIWWNEQWMGWPLGPQYEASSNLVNAHRLQGKLLLVVGEMDTNVDPASTLQVVNALIKANKQFDLLYIPGAGHTAGGAYGERKRFDFFVQHLLGVRPPDWNSLPPLTDSPAPPEE